MSYMHMYAHKKKQDNIITCNWPPWEAPSTANTTMWKYKNKYIYKSMHMCTYMQQITKQNKLHLIGNEFINL